METPNYKFTFCVPALSFLPLKPQNAPRRPDAAFISSFSELRMCHKSQCVLISVSSFFNVYISFTLFSLNQTSYFKACSLAFLPSAGLHRFCSLFLRCWLGNKQFLGNSTHRMLLSAFCLLSFLFFPSRIVAYVNCQRKGHFNLPFSVLWPKIPSQRGKHYQTQEIWSGPSKYRNTTN